MSDMKKYEVIIDLGSKTFIVEANDKEEAEQKALLQFEALPSDDKIEEYWVGDMYEYTED